jgi:hypothetical protein
MKKMFAVLTIALMSIIVITPAHAQLKDLLPGGGAKKGGGGDIGAQVKLFIDRSTLINSLAVNALKTINLAYASDEDIKKGQAEMKTMDAITDPQEKAAKMNAAYKTEKAKAEENIKSKDIQERTKNLSAEKQKLIASSVGNFLIAALQAGELSSDGQNIMQSASANPMDLPKIAPVKDALPLLADAVSTSTKVIPGFVKVLQGANIEVPKVTAKSTPEETKF